MAESYNGLSDWLSPPWFAAATIHSLIASFVAAYWWLHDRKVFTPGTWQSYLPATFVLGASAAVALLSRVLGGVTINAVSDSNTHPTWAAVIWVPLVEELVFRAGIGAVYRRLSQPIWAAWFAALVFALVHANPTWSNLIHGQVGLALGAFLLGLCCEYLMIKTGRILPCIAFHSACNATVMIFGILDKRWLDWLAPLYL
jgi:membrane protease YdiL (CAAX protease family)